MLSAAIVTTLVSRRDEMSRKFFLYISLPTSYLHHLLPDPKDLSVISRIRAPFFNTYQNLTGRVW